MMPLVSYSLCGILTYLSEAAYKPRAGTDSTDLLARRRCGGATVSAVPLGFDPSNVTVKQTVPEQSLTARVQTAQDVVLLCFNPPTKIIWISQTHTVHMDTDSQLQ